MRAKLNCELLEAREVPANVTWNGAWVGGVEPAKGDYVTFIGTADVTLAEDWLSGIDTNLYNGTITTDTDGLTLTGENGVNSVLRGGVIALRGDLHIEGDAEIGNGASLGGQLIRNAGWFTTYSVVIEETGDVLVNGTLDTDVSILLEGDLVFDRHPNPNPLALGILWASADISLVVSPGAYLEGRWGNIEGNYHCDIINYGTVIVDGGPGFTNNRGGLHNTNSGTLRVKSWLSLQGTVTAGGYTDSLVSTGSVELHGGSTLTLKHGGTFAGGVVSVGSDGTAQRATVTGGNEFDSLRFVGATLSIQQTANNLPAELRVTSGNNDFFVSFEGGTLEVRRVGNGLSWLTCPRVVCDNGSKLKVIGAAGAGTWTAVDCTLNEPDDFGTYDLPTGMTHSWVDGDLKVTQS